MDQSERLNNPAARVHSILAAAKSSTAPTILEGYARIFELQPSQLGEIYRQLGILDEQAEDIGRVLKELGETDQYGLYMEALPSIKGNILVRHFAVQWEELKRGIRNEDLTTLRFCANTLAKRRPEKTISADQLKIILERAQSLYDDILTSELDSQLRVILLNQLSDISRAIHEYRVGGIGSLQQAISNAVVTTIDQAQRIQSEEKLYSSETGSLDDESPRPKNPVRDFVSLISDLITIGTCAVMVSPTLGPYLHHVLQAAQ